MATYLDLQTRVQRRVIDLPSSVQTEVPDLINEAMHDLQDMHNFEVMKETAEFTTTLLTRTLGARPADWKEWRGKPYYREYLGGTELLDIGTTVRAAERRFGTNSDYDFDRPQALVLDDETEAGTGNILIYPFPDGNSEYSDGEYRIVIPYWKYVADLSADTDTNWFTTSAQTKRFIIDKATSMAFDINWDEARAQYWEKRAMARFNKALLKDKYRKLSGMTTLVPHMGANDAALKE